MILSTQLYNIFKKYKSKLKHNQKTTEDTFTEIYKKSIWKSESLSGRGSDLQHTAVIRNEIPKLLKELKIQSMLDIPCGDFNWLKKVNLDSISYIGADIVEDAIKHNIKKYSNPSRKFFKLDLISDNLPQVDLIFCRDCLVHLPFKDILKAIKNIEKSKSKYILTTSFPNQTENTDIITGQWRPLNLLLPPFTFPEPLKIINEQYMGDEEKFTDKSLLLWKIEDLELYH